MDRKQRKQLTQDYKRNELENLAQSTESILAKYAKQKLGQYEPVLSPDKLMTLNDSDLIEAFVNKINNTVEQTFLSNPQKYKSRENVLKGLRNTHQYIYSIYHFENQVGIGDTDKYFESTSVADKNALIDAYQFFGRELLTKYIKAEDSEYFNKNYNEISRLTNKSLINFIRTNADEFK